MTIDRTLLLRMIDDDEYYQMVGGSADDVVDVLLGAPRPGEALSLDRYQFDDVVSALGRVAGRAGGGRDRMRWLRGHQGEMLAGDYGYVVRSGVISELAPVLRAVTCDQLRAEFVRYPRWQRDDVAAELDQHLTALELLQAFVSETAQRMRSLHVVSASSLDPRRYPHRLRQRLARAAKQARRAANGTLARRVDPRPPATVPGRTPVVGTEPDRLGGMVHGVIRDAGTGAPLSNVEIALRQRDGAPWLTSTDASGRFEIGPLAPGDYAFSAYYDGAELADGRVVNVITGRETIVDEVFAV
ncbi:MAG: carboxypeptidase regulatory-like domain-containing protein [Kofleriaceae bacterium]